MLPPNHLWPFFLWRRVLRIARNLNEAVRQGRRLRRWGSGSTWSGLVGEARVFACRRSALNTKSSNIWVSSFSTALGARPKAAVCMAARIQTMSARTPSTWRLDNVLQTSMRNWRREHRILLKSFSAIECCFLNYVVCIWMHSAERFCILVVFVHAVVPICTRSSKTVLIAKVSTINQNDLATGTPTPLCGFMGANKVKSEIHVVTLMPSRSISGWHAGGYIKQLVYKVIGKQVSLRQHTAHPPWARLSKRV